ncbi:MAG TPA: acyltransferase [Patescibacteria group bacterium]|nr:acyltransferase [Patescibacteria group bacterium]
MRLLFSGWLKKFQLFRIISWIREGYAREHIEYNGLFRRCGENVHISGKAWITNCDKISVGDNVRIQEGVWINGAGGLYIGSNVGISYRTTIWTVEHNYLNANAVPFDERILLRPIRINDNVWVGAGVSITSGVEIGEGAVIGIASVVTKDVPPMAIVLGNPARVLGSRDKEHYERLKAEGKFVEFTRQGEEIVPLYIQKRPRLYEIIADYAKETRAVLERGGEDKEPS